LELPFAGVKDITIEELRRYVKGKAPPVVFITGNASAMSPAETKVVRKYLDQGGTLFADPQDSWQQHFVNWANTLYPGERLMPIDNKQDAIFDGRFYFPGPPAFWSGNKSFLGIKHNGRWIIICDRGRMADGWKPPVTEDCVKMGINIISYAFDQYYSGK